MPIPLGILAVAGAGGGALVSNFDLLATTVLGSNSTIEFTGLDTYGADYKHLQFRAVLQTNSTSTLNLNPSIRFNGDVTNNYYNHRLNGDATTASSSQTVSAGSQFDLTDGSPGYGGDAGIFGVAIIDILDFSNTNKNTTIRAFAGSLNTGEFDVSLHSGFFNKTNAITSILFNSTFRTNTRVSVYGIKG